MRKNYERRKLRSDLSSREKKKEFGNNSLIGKTRDSER